MILHSTVLTRFMEVSTVFPGLLPAFESIADNDNVFMGFHSLQKFLHIFILFRSVLWMV